VTRHTTVTEQGLAVKLEKVIAAGGRRALPLAWAAN
jgi:hypothetical protein